MTQSFFLKNGLGWGFLLWLIGYLLGFVFFFLLPPALIGWAIMPIGFLLTTWVLWRKIPALTMQKALLLALTWTLIAIIGDYLGIVRLLHPADGYYKLDVYLYYVTTFVLPIVVAWRKGRV